MKMVYERLLWKRHMAYFQANMEMQLQIEHTNCRSIRQLNGFKVLPTAVTPLIGTSPVTWGHPAYQDELTMEVAVPKWSGFPV